ncbi:Elongation of fatty acids protein 2 [Naganishia adeliensis]|uniref:Elongation of fatty acids protein 2 n=1 Tax=Naganishia adeliensis TaxID=92952 RepID=A0ACC2WT61_9TREE|nr:Elongation of fatty acids protein 2 [Naganishia adeliensis]
MGIKGKSASGLTALLSENAPKAMKEHDIKTLFGRKVAIDASMSIYQFLIAVRQKDGTMLMNENGDVTSHLMGFFWRTLRMVDHGIKPAYVFDGKPPELKGGVLAKRFAARSAAAEAEEEAKETGTAEDIDKLARRQVKPTKAHNEECRRLLKLMGIPVIVAPGEAEAQCAELARGGKVYGAGSEDMDTLTFNAPVLLRHLTFSEAKKAPISEINLKQVLEELEMDMERFIELCLLLGCDYLEPAKGVGPKTALKLMREHGTLENVVAHIRGKMAEKQEAAEEFEIDEKPGSDVESDEEEEAKLTDAESAAHHDLESEDGYEKPVAATMSGSEDEEGPKPRKTATQTKKGKGKKKAEPKKVPIKKKKAIGGMQLPEYWPWEEAKKLFMKPDVTPANELELEWTKCDEEGLIDFLVKEKGFNEDRVRAGAARLDKMLNQKQQGRLDGFFKVTPKDKPAAGSAKNGKDTKKTTGKRKADEKEKPGAKKAKGKK